MKPKCKGCGRPFKVGPWDAGVQRSFTNPEKCVRCDLMGVVTKKWVDKGINATENKKKESE